MKEKHYQRALAVAFKKAGIKFKEQAPVVMHFEGEIIGRYFLDFIIEDKLVLEIKQGEYFGSSNIKQTADYLKALKLELAILANFTHKGVKYKRIVNVLSPERREKQD